MPEATRPLRQLGFLTIGPFEDYVQILTAAAK